MIFEQTLESDYGRFAERLNAPDSQQHTWHERLAVDRVVTDRQRLPDVAEDHFLVRDKTRKAD